MSAYPVSIASVTCSSDKDVSSLADSERHVVGLVGDDRHKVVGDDRHGVIVDGEPLKSFGARVDQTQPVGFASRELELGQTSVRRAGVISISNVAVVDHFTVDECVVGEYDRSIRGETLLYKRVVIVVEPVVDKYGPKVNVVWSTGRTVDDHRTVGTASPLRRVMRVVPA